MVHVDRGIVGGGRLRARARYAKRYAHAKRRHHANSDHARRGTPRAHANARHHCGSCSMAFLLEHVRLRLKHVNAAYSVHSPPPCGEGLGVGVARFFANGATVISPYHPSPHPSPSRLRACPLPANFSVTKPRQAGVWLGREQTESRGRSFASAWDRIERRGGASMT